MSHTFRSLRIAPPSADEGRLRVARLTELILANPDPRGCPECEGTAVQLEHAEPDERFPVPGVRAYYWCAQCGEHWNRFAFHYDDMALQRVPWEQRLYEQVQAVTDA